MLLLVFFLEYILVPVIYLWQFALVVYDTMGYINTVNQTAEASIASSIRGIQNTDSYKHRNGVVCQCNPSIVIRHVSINIYSLAL